MQSVHGRSVPLREYEQSSKRSPKKKRWSYVISGCIALLCIYPYIPTEQHRPLVTVQVEKPPALETVAPVVLPEKETEKQLAVVKPEVVEKKVRPLRKMKNMEDEPVLSADRGRRGAEEISSTNRNRGREGETVSETFVFRGRY